MSIELIFTIIGFIITIIGVHYKQENRISLLEQMVKSNKEVTDDNFAKLIKAIDKLDISIEKLNDKIEKINK